MPMLPGGRHIALQADPLLALMKHWEEASNVHHIMAIKAWPDLFPWLDVLYLMPASSAQEDQPLHFTKSSSPAPPNMVAMKAGYRLQDWEAHASGWPTEDRAAMRAFLDNRAQAHFEKHLERIRAIQELLLAHPNTLPGLLAHMWRAGCHPLQEDGVVPTRSPDWDTYDLLAALGYIRHVASPTLREQFKPALTRLQGIWLILVSLLPALIDASQFTDPETAAVTMRNTASLDALPPDKCQWFRSQAVMECLVLWTQLEEALSELPTWVRDTLQLAALSPEAAAPRLTAAENDDIC